MFDVLQEIDCPVEDCELLKAYYIGQTQNSISRRMTEHLQNGVLKDYVRNSHINNLTRLELLKKCIQH